MNEDAKGPRDYLAIAARRRTRLIIPAVLVLIISVAVAFLVPKVYRSTATVLIEEAEVPSEFIQSTITSFAAQRLQVIQQRVMTTLNLAKIIDKFDLYAEARENTPINVVAQNMRKSITLELVSAEVIDPRIGRSTESTIAFNLSFESGDPEITQKVAEELVSLYLNENLRDRRAKAAETTGFFAEETGRLGRVVSEMEDRLATFKRENSGQLPEQLDLNMQIIQRTQGELQETDRRFRLLEERKILLESELAQLSPHGARVIDGETILSPPERLKALQAKYFSLRGIYGENHPDVAKLRREMAILRKETGARTDVNALKAQLQSVSNELLVKKKKYGARHPDVVQLERQAASLRAAIGADGASGRSRALEPKPDNPAYIMVQGQVRSVEAEMKSLRVQRRKLKATLEAHEARVLRTPETERQYLAIKRDYENAYDKYKDVKAKQLEAQLAQSLETERKSERFILIEPPQLPLAPVRPNRLAIILIGFIFAGVAGAGNAFLAESMDETVHGSRQLAAVTGEQPLVVIPMVKPNTGRAGRRVRTVILSLVLLSVAIAAAVAVHIYVTPLDAVWRDALSHIGVG